MPTKNNSNTSTTTNTKKTKSKIGDKVKFYDEQNREFNGTIEKLNSNNSASIKVCRLMGHSQIYLSVPCTTKKEKFPRYN